MIALLATNSSDQYVRNVELFGALEKFKDPSKWNADTEGLCRVNIRTALDEKLFNTMNYVDIIYNITTGSEIKARTVRVVSDQAEGRVVNVTVLEKNMNGGSYSLPLQFRKRDDQVITNIFDLHFKEPLSALVIGKNTSFLIEQVRPKENLTFYFYDTHPEEAPRPTLSVAGGSAYHPG